MTSFFHTYDLRGKYPEEISEKEAENVGKAFGTFTDSEEVLVGRDGREHGKDITDAFIKGVRSTGVDVVFAGLAPSPVIYFGVYDRDIDSGVVVTASHNPPEYTGFKFCKQNALAMSRDTGMKQIQKIYERKEFETGEKGEKQDVDLKDDYIEFIDERIDLDTELDIAVNFGNGATCEIGREVLEEIGCNVKAINGEIDGSFPNHLPDPGDEDAQRQLEEEMTDEDLGIIFDGDGDRAGFIVPDYGHVEPDKVMSLFSEKVLEKRKGKVLHDLRASKLVSERIREKGGEPQEMRVGHVFFSEAIFENSDIVFGGELSGHYYFPGIGAPWDDGVLAGALMCQISSEDDIVRKLESYPDYPVSPELRIDCPEDAKQKVIEGIKDEYSSYEMETVDGVKIKFENGWSLVRPSSTEEKMSVRSEADTEDDLEEISSRIEESVRKKIDLYS